ncbi:MAG: hypothetical protein ACTS2F_29625 [Thainema sp.]
MVDICVVTDDIFLLALDDFFRDKMKFIESNELLECARNIASELGIEPKDCPVEGYYHETPELTEYFKLVRRLQDIDSSSKSKVIRSKNNLERLSRVCGSKVFGQPDKDRSGLLPRRKDVVAKSLEKLAPDWNLNKVIEEAKALCSDDDCSLVGMACAFGSPYVVAALRETAALYTAMMLGCAMEELEYTYKWEVSEKLEQLANSFIQVVKQDMGFRIPSASACNAEKYYKRGEKADIVGRCIAIGLNDAVEPVQYYHWGIRWVDGKYEVEEFWNIDLWTTERYRKSIL